MKTAIRFVLVCLLLCSCSSKRTQTAKIENTNWKYSDFEISYNLSFEENGKLISTHPNDKTPGNDFWKQRGEIITFSFNDKYSTYEFKYTGKDSIHGKAKNENLRWEFKLIRIY